jgi:cytosine/adenosine deaminase-related metal-dependent hydrolase
MANDRILIRGGSIVTMDPAIGDLRSGDVLIEHGVIVAVAPEIEASDARVLEAGGDIVMPGLVDPHRHLWYSAIRGVAMDATLDDMVTTMWPQLAVHYTPEDLYATTRAAAADALAHGITTVLDWCHIINTPDHGPEAIRALREVPLRTVFAYGASMERKLGEFEGFTEHEDSWEPARRLRRGELSSDSGRITMALALQGPEFTSLEATREDIRVGDELDLPMSMHCGLPAGAPPKAAIKVLDDAGLLTSRMQFVHCCTTSDEEFERLAAAGGTAAACPMAEIGMGMGEPPIGRMKAAGLRPSVGADAVCAASGDQFDEARLALYSERGAMVRKHLAEGAPATRSDFPISSREALETITINAAESCWLDHRVGSLTPGKAADVIVLDGRALNIAPASDLIGTLVSSAHGLNVRTVIVDGQIVRENGAFVNLDIDAIRGGLQAARDRIFTAGGFQVEPAFAG